MSSHSILLTPGPVPLHPKVREILAQPAEHHRTPQFTAILTEALSALPSVFQTEQKALILPSTGSGAMEALIVNSFSPGDEVICVLGGKFGERFAKIAQVYGLITHLIEVPWGEAVSLDQVRETLSRYPQSKALLVQACETSTATAHPIKELGLSLRQEAPEVLFYVDAITALGAYDLKMDEWYIDGLIGGSQKAFMLPVGLSLLSLSEKAWRAVDQARLPRFYFDLKQELIANSKDQTFFSSPVHLIKALNFMLHWISERGLSTFFAEIQRRADFTYALAQISGLELLSKSPSPSVTALKVPASIDGKKWRSRLETKYGVVLMGGQDQLEGKILRIGHMGYITDDELIEFADRLGQSLKEEIPTFSPPLALRDFAQDWLESHR